MTYGEFSQNNTTPYTPFPGNVSMLKFQVESVNGPAHTVNATFVFTYKNGTQSSQPLSGNTETGQGNLFPYLVAGNLTAGDLLLNAPFSFYPYVFNETVERVYAGALRTVNLLNLTIALPGQYARVLFYWDVQTGIVLDAAEYANFTSPTPSTLAIHFKATATNVWTPSTEPDYSLDASSLSSAVLHAGDSTTFRLDLASVNNFTGSINLQASLPSSNATHPPSITLNPTILTLSASDPTASAQLTVSTNMLTNQGSYIITINGTSGSINHQAQLLVAVVPPDFIINANPSNLTIPQNSSKSATITVTGRGGFTGVVLLQAQTQPFGTIVTANLNQTVITLNSTITTTTSTLTVNTLGSLPGTATIYITANSGTIYRNLYLNVNVTGPDFRINANPASLTIKQGQTGQSTITLTSILGFTGPINLSTSFSGTISASLTNNFISLTPGLEANTTLTVTVPSNTPPGFAYVDVTGTSTNNLSHSVFLPLNITGPDFTFSASNTFLTLNAGQSANSTLTLSSRQGFSGTISLTTSSFSSNVQSTVNPQSVTLNSTIVSSTSQLTITVPPSTTPGYTEVTVTATSSNLVHYVYIQISIVGPDFSVTTNPSFLSIRQGGSAESTVTLSSIDNFSGNVTLSASLYYPASLYLTAALGNSQVKVTAGGSANTTLTIQTPTFTPPGSYYVQITATSGALTRYGQVFVSVIGPDFSLSASPSYLVMPQGTSTNTTIAMTSIDNLNGTATLFVAFSSPIIVSPNTTTLALAANSTSTATFKLSVPANTIPGYYYVHMTGYLGSVTHDFSIQIQVTGPDFTIFATPPSLTIQRGSTATSTIIVNSLKGFNGTVSLTLFSLGLTVTPTNATVTLTPGGTGSVTVTIQAPTPTPPGSYYVSVNANSNSNSSIIAHYTQIYVQVTGPDFSIQSNPYFLIIEAGQSGQSTIQLTSLDGFSGNITLTTNYFIVVGGPNFTQSPVNVTLNPRTVTLASGTTSSSILDISSTLAAAGQNFTIFITATGNNETHYTQVYVSIIGPSFRLSADQNFLIIPAGGSATTTITATSVDGFSGNLSLSVASFSGFQVSLIPKNITLTSGGSANSTLSITVPSSAGSNWYYNVVVTATSSGITRSTYITVLVIAPSFSITANPIFLNLAPGTTGKATLTLTGSNGFSGKISLFSSSTPTGLETSITPSIVTLNSTLTSTTADLTITVPANTSPGFYNINIDAASASLNENITVVVLVSGPDFGLYAIPSSFEMSPGTSATSTITIFGMNGFNGTVQLFSSISTGPGITTSFSPDNVTLTPSGPNATSTMTISVAPSAYAGPYVITIIGSLATNSNTTSLEHTTAVTVFVPAIPNFQMLVNTGLLTIQQGSSGQVHLTLNSLNGFSGTVTITAEIIPQGPTVSPAKTMVTLAMNGTVMDNLTVAAGVNTPPGIYTLVLNATSAGISHPNSVEVMVVARPDFTLTAGPAFQTIQAGNSGSVFVVLVGQDGFAATVELSAIVTPPGLTAVSIPSTVQVSSNNITQAVVTITTTKATILGNYTIDIIGNSTSGFHTVSITVTVTPRSDFKLSSSASAMIIQTGASAASTLSVSPVAGFTGSVTLSATAPPGFTTNFSVNPITGGSGTSTLNITVASSVGEGSYILTVTGSSGSITHSATINVTVAASAKTTLVVTQVSWTHRLSLSKNSTTQTFTLNVKNTGVSPAYVQLLAAGNSTDLKSFFNVESGVTLLSPGASITITLSQPFNATGIGVKFNFTIELFYGTSIDPAGTILSPHTLQAVKGSFTIVK